MPPRIIAGQCVLAFAQRLVHLLSTLGYSILFRTANADSSFETGDVSIATSMTIEFQDAGL